MGYKTNDKVNKDNYSDEFNITGSRGFMDYLNEIIS